MSELDVLKAKVEELAAKIGGDVHKLWDEFLVFVENKKPVEITPPVTTVAGIEPSSVETQPTV